MKELFSAFIKFQSEFKGLKPDAENPFFKSNYITLDGILETVRPILSKHGLAVIQNAYSKDGNMCIKTLLIHESGNFMESEEMTMKPVKDDPQQRGSVITYMKRYQLGALLGICESIDDDGNAATGNNSGKQNKQQKQQNSNQQNSQQQNKQPVSQGQSHKPASENQLKAIHAGSTKKNVDVKELIKSKYNIDSSKDLTSQQASEIISYINSL